VAEVNDHDFHIDAEGRVIPCGIYDEQQNRGCLVGPVRCDPNITVGTRAPCR